MALRVVEQADDDSHPGYLVRAHHPGLLHRAEGPLAAWPRDAALRALRADALELFALVQRWTRDRPANMTGVIWYRLPVATDAMNWRWPTLAAIVAGRAPRRALRVEAGSGQPCDIALVNEGEIDEPLPARISATWRDACLAREPNAAIDVTPRGYPAT